MLTAWTPFFVARRTVAAIRSCATFAFRRRARWCATAAVAIRIVIAFRPRAVPTSFALTKSVLSRGIARVPKLAALEPFQRRAGMLLAKTVEGGKQFLHIMRAERCRLIVDDDRPVRVSWRHREQSYVEGANRAEGAEGAERCGYSLAVKVEVVVAPIAELRKRMTTRFEEIVGKALADGDSATAEPYRFSCGITGGSAALIFLGALRDADVPWRRITLYWGDERAVPPDHPDSNYALCERLLISPLGARAPHAERMEGESPDLHAAARAYDARLPPALDLIILGVGEDGHVCSLFPAHQALQVDDARVLVIEDSPKPPPRRLTLSLPYVCESGRVWVVALGEAKRPVLQAAVSGVARNTPLDLVAQGAREVTVLTDQAIRTGVNP
jgi:6-phosphogluconolactonase